MKKIKWSIMTLAVVFSISSAFVTRPKAFSCGNDVQYYYQGGAYLMAGTYGLDFQCGPGSGTCTYYFTGVTYLPCSTGTFQNLDFKGKE
jgi:hypothetical protein